MIRKQIQCSLLFLKRIHSLINSFEAINGYRRKQPHMYLPLEVYEPANQNQPFDCLGFKKFRNQCALHIQDVNVEIINRIIGFNS